MAVDSCVIISCLFKLEGDDDPDAPKAPAAAPPPMTKSWAEALGVVIPKEEAPAPAWGGVAVAAAPAQHARDSENPLPFEFALQEALKALVVTAPGKEMKKRCVLYGCCSSCLSIWLWWR